MRALSGVSATLLAFLEGVKLYPVSAIGEPSVGFKMIFLIKRVRSAISVLTFYYKTDEDVPFKINFGKIIMTLKKHMETETVKVDRGCCQGLQLFPWIRHRHHNLTFQECI